MCDVVIRAFGSVKVSTSVIGTASLFVELDNYRQLFGGGIHGLRASGSPDQESQRDGGPRLSLPPVTMRFVGILGVLALC